MHSPRPPVRSTFIDYSADRGCRLICRFVQLSAPSTRLNCPVLNFNRYLIRHLVSCSAVRTDCTGHAGRMLTRNYSCLSRKRGEGGDGMDALSLFALTRREIYAATDPWYRVDCVPRGGVEIRLFFSILAAFLRARESRRLEDNGAVTTVRCVLPREREREIFRKSTDRNEPSSTCGLRGGP